MSIATPEEGFACDPTPALEQMGEAVRQRSRRADAAAAARSLRFAAILLAIRAILLPITASLVMFSFSQEERGQFGMLLDPAAGVVAGCLAVMCLFASFVANWRPLGISVMTLSLYVVAWGAMLVRVETPALLGQLGWAATGLLLLGACFHGLVHRTR